MAEQKEYPQFESCKYGGGCLYCDASGQCIFETCIWDDEFPPAKNTWSYTCQICGKNVSKATKDVRIHICDSCLARLRRSASCKECGNGPL